MQLMTPDWIFKLVQESVSLVAIAVRQDRSWQGATRQHGRPHVTRSNDARGNHDQRNG